MGFARNYQVIWFFNNVDDNDGHVSTLSPEGWGWEGSGGEEEEAVTQTNP